MQQCADPAFFHHLLQRRRVGRAGPARDPGKQGAGLQRAHVVQHPLQPLGVGQRGVQAVAVGQGRQLGARCVLLRLRRQAPGLDGRLVAGAVGAQPGREFVHLALQRQHLLRQGLHLLSVAHGQRVVLAFGVEGAQQRRPRSFPRFHPFRRGAPRPHEQPHLQWRPRAGGLGQVDAALAQLRHRQAPVNELVPLGFGLLPAANQRLGHLRPGTDALQATLQRPLRWLGEGRWSQPVARPERAVAQGQLAELLQQRPQVGKARRRCGAAARLQLHRAGGGQRRQRQRGVLACHQQLEPARRPRAHHGASPPRGKAARRTSSPRRRSHSSADSAK